MKTYSNCCQRRLMHLIVAYETYSFSFRQRILLLAWMQGHCFFERFLILVHVCSSLIIADNKAHILSDIFCYFCLILINCSNQSYLVTIPVFSAFFILTFSLSGTFFSVADAVRSCRMGPIALTLWSVQAQFQSSQLCLKMSHLWARTRTVRLKSTIADMLRNNSVTV